jgi:hypothetical protein
MEPSFLPAHVEHAQHVLTFVRTGESQNRLFRLEESNLAQAQRRVLAASREDASCEVQH